MKKRKRTNYDPGARNYLTLKYHWEFLRRRDSYKQDFSKFLLGYQKESKKQYNQARSQDFNDITSLKIGEKVKNHFTKKYRLGLPMNPNISFERLGYGSAKNWERNRRNTEWGWRAFMFRGLGFGRSPGFGVHYHPIIKLLTKIPLDSNVKKHMLSKVVLEVDLTFTLEEILCMFKNYIEFCKTERRSVGLDKERMRFDKYDGYLEIYDLKQNNKSISLTGIAKKLFPKEYKKAKKQVAVNRKDVDKTGEAFNKYFKEFKGNVELAYRKAYGDETNVNKAVQMAIDRLVAAKKRVEEGIQKK